MDTGTPRESGLAPDNPFTDAMVRVSRDFVWGTDGSDELTAAIARHPAGTADQPAAKPYPGPAGRFFSDYCRAILDGPRLAGATELESPTDSEPEHPDYSEPNTPWPPDDGHERGYN